MFGWKLIREDQFNEMEDLISSLKTFIFVAKTDRKKSAAVEFVDNEIKQYERRWKQ